MSDDKTPKDLFLWAHGQDDIVWMSQNTNDIPTHPAIEEAMIEAIKARKYNQYPYIHGLPGLRELLLDDLGLPHEDYDVMLTSGALEALYVIHRALLREGDEVISTDPTFVPLHKQIEMSGALPVAIPIYGTTWKLTEEQVRENLNSRTKAILFIDPHNPLGSGYSREEVRTMASIAKENDLWFIHDITYRDFAYEHTLASEFYPEKTVFAYSFSKNTGFAGLRMGALIAPKDKMDIFRRYEVSGLSVNIVSQVGAKVALETKKEWLDNIVSTARKNQEIIKSAVDRVEGAYIPVYPSNTNMLVIDLYDTGVDQDELQKRMLLEDKVFIRSGGYVSRKFGNRFIRVSFTVSNEGAERFAESFVKQMEALRG